jgi:hypothetical protein
MNREGTRATSAKAGATPPGDPTDIGAVAEFVAGIHRTLFTDADPAFAPKAFNWMSDAFSGRHPDFSGIDCGYHDVEHTMQVTICLVQLLSGYAAAAAQPRLTRRAFELGILAALFHDSGYLKRREDLGGTGAKYTRVHVARGGDFVAKLMLRDGYAPEDVEAVRSMIDCTEHGGRPEQVSFRTALDRVVGYSLGTADLLAQMAAPNYLEKLERLYDEFEEARRQDDDDLSATFVFDSAQDLVRRTPAFWRGYVLPRLQNDFRDLYRYLSPDGSDASNAYLQDVLRNVNLIHARHESAGEKR